MCDDQFYDRFPLFVFLVLRKESLLLSHVSHFIDVFYVVYVFSFFFACV